MFRLLSKRSAFGSANGTLCRSIAAQAQPLPDTESELESAKPFEAIPRQSFFSRDFLPGGDLFGKTLPEIIAYFQKKHGSIVYVPGAFRRASMLFTYEPSDFEKVYRNEGVWPHRFSIESLSYWRREHRTDVFKDFHGLVDE